MKRFALETGETVGLHQITREPSSHALSHGWIGIFIEVDPKTGIAYTVQFGRPVEPDELVGK